jgi:hypothetical protein
MQTLPTFKMSNCLASVISLLLNNCFSNNWYVKRQWNSSGLNWTRLEQTALASAWRISHLAQLQASTQHSEF